MLGYQRALWFRKNKKKSCNQRTSFSDSHDASHSGAEFPRVENQLSQINTIITWLVVWTPLKNMSSSVGMMTFPTEWKNKNHVPNHQPDNVIALMLKPPTIRKESECQSHSSHDETQILLNNPIRFIKLAKKGASWPTSKNKRKQIVPKKTTKVKLLNSKKNNGWIHQ